MTRVAAIIPARYASSRFPGKPLVPILGVPLVLRVARACESAVERHNIYVATESIAVAEVARGAGYACVMTSPDHPTGTDRIAEAAGSIDADVFINVQGDEPLVRKADIDAVIDAKRRFPAEVICGMAPISADAARSPNVPKVVAARDGRMIYMSRAAVPATKSGLAEGQYMRQVCIYGFDRDQLERFRAEGRTSEMERREDIELLRLLELGIPVRMVVVSSGSAAVDVPDDVAVVERLLQA